MTIILFSLLYVDVTYDILNDNTRTDYKGVYLSKKAHRTERLRRGLYPFLSLRSCAGFLLFIRKGVIKMSETDKRIALIGIILTSHESVDRLNALLSQSSDYIVGRMGIPYRNKGISIISVAMDAPNDIISALSGKIGMLPGISTKTIYAKTP